MNTLKEFNPLYVELQEKYKKQGSKAPGALAFLDLCTYASEHPDEIDKQRASWTLDDKRAHTMLLEDSFSNEDLRVLSEIGFHPMQRCHYRKLLEKRLREAAGGQTGR